MELLGGLDPDHPGPGRRVDRGGGGHDGDLGPASHGTTATIAAPIRPEERFPRYRTGSSGSRVPPG